MQPELHTRLTELARAHAVPGATLAVLVGDELHEAVTGVANVETGVAVTSDTVFQSGSIGKLFIATVVIQLVEQGELELDAPVVRMLPGFRLADPFTARTVTLRQLLCHTSGIEGDHFPDLGRGFDAVARFVESCAELGQVHPPGATMSYCNTGYVIAGRLIELVTGLPWMEALRQRLFEPLGMRSSVVLPEEVLRFRAAFGHVGADEGDARLAPVWTLSPSTGPAGDVCQTARDLVAFARMHLDAGRAPDGAPVISPAGVHAMQQPQAAVPDPYTVGDHWGLGWILSDWNGRRVIGHDGSSVGQNGFLAVVPDARIVIALMTNGGRAHDLQRELFAELMRELAGLRMPQQLEPADPPLPPAPARFRGRYETAAVRVEVEDRGHGLGATVTPLGPLAALAAEPVRALELDAARPGVFVASEAGRPTGEVAVFYDVPSVGRYLHMGGRALPRVA